MSKLRVYWLKNKTKFFWISFIIFIIFLITYFNLFSFTNLFRKKNPSKANTSIVDEAKIDSPASYATHWSNDNYNNYYSNILFGNITNSSSYGLYNEIGAFTKDFQTEIVNAMSSNRKGIAKIVKKRTIRHLIEGSIQNYSKNIIFGIKESFSFVNTFVHFSNTFINFHGNINDLKPYFFKFITNNVMSASNNINFLNLFNRNDESESTLRKNDVISVIKLVKLGSSYMFNYILKNNIKTIFTKLNLNYNDSNELSKVNDLLDKSNIKIQDILNDFILFYCNDLDNAKNIRVFIENFGIYINKLMWSLIHFSYEFITINNLDNLLDNVNQKVKICGISFHVNKSKINQFIKIKGVVSDLTKWFNTEDIKLTNIYFGKNYIKAVLNNFK